MSLETETTKLVRSAWSRASASVSKAMLSLVTHLCASVTVMAPLLASAAWALASASERKRWPSEVYQALTVPSTVTLVVLASLACCSASAFVAKDWPSEVSHEVCSLTVTVTVASLAWAWASPSLSKDLPSEVLQEVALDTVGLAASACWLASCSVANALPSEVLHVVSEPETLTETEASLACALASASVLNDFPSLVFHVVTSSVHAGLSTTVLVVAAVSVTQRHSWPEGAAPRAWRRAWAPDLATVWDFPPAASALAARPALVAGTPCAASAARAEAGCATMLAVMARPAATAPKRRPRAAKRTRPEFLRCLGLPCIAVSFPLVMGVYIFSFYADPFSQPEV